VRTVKLLLQYEGTEYAGWQVQDNAVTIQELVERALTTILREKIRVAGASRTDSGVHALGQVAAFKTSESLSLDRLLRSLNGILPQDIRVMEASEVADDFDPRFAKEKTYRYALACGKYLSPFQRRYAWHIKEPLDSRRMQEAAGALIGEHDFSSFTASGGGEKSPIRRISGLDFGRGGIISTCFKDTCFESESRGAVSQGVEDNHDETIFHFDITANGFLYKMVRNIIGTLVKVGRGTIALEDMLDIITAKDRSRAGPTAPAHGLCLLSVQY
jgi:tRNA pseudouridine38-40 synthase